MREPPERSGLTDFGTAGISLSCAIVSAIAIPLGYMNVSSAAFYNHIASPIFFWTQFGVPILFLMNCVRVSAPAGDTRKKLGRVMIWSLGIWTILFASSWILHDWQCQGRLDCAVTDEDLRQVMHDR